MAFKSEEFVPQVTTPKLLGPGTHTARVVDIQLQTPPYDKTMRTLNFKLEGTPEPTGFEGIDVDKTNPSLGKYEGRIAFVNNGAYSFKEWTTPRGELLTVDTQIYRYINNIARNLGVLEQIQKDKFEANTIEEYVAGIKKYICDPELWGYFTIAGKEYFTEGYKNPNYKMFFPKYENRKSAVALTEEGVIPFNKEKHIIKSEQGTPVATPAPSDDDIGITIPTADDPLG